MKKIICIILVSVTALSLFAFSGCSENNPQNTDKVSDTTDTVSEAETTAYVTETEAVKDDLPDITFGGEEFHILSQSDGLRHYDVFAEEADTGDSVRDAVFMRNLAVEDRFQIKIAVEFMDYTSVNNTIDRIVKAGSDEFDLCFVTLGPGSSLIMKNDYVSFNKLEYINLSKPWWDKSLQKSFSIDGNLFMASGDISPSSFSSTSCLYFNKTIFDKYDLEYPYQLVRDGKWTLDKLIELTKDFTADGDGDGKLDPYGTSDTFGLTSWVYDVPYSLYYGAGGSFVSKDENDIPFYDPHLERDTAIYEKIYDVMITNQAYMELSDYNNVGNVFIKGQAMFYDASFLLASRLREMDDEFGIIPLPKFSESQESYRSYVNTASSMVCVPVSCKNLERAAVITEALASGAYQTVTPVLYESYLKRKITRDADSAEMIDYIVRNRAFDMVVVNLFDGIGSYVRTLLTSKSKNVSSMFEKYEKQSKRGIEQLIKAYNKSAGK